MSSRHQHRPVLDTTINPPQGKAYGYEIDKEMGRYYRRKLKCRMCRRFYFGKWH